MTQILTRNKKEEVKEKLVRLEKEFNKKIKKDPEFKKQLDNMGKSLRNSTQNYKNQIDSINNLGLSDKQMRIISEESQKIFILPRKKTKKIEPKETNFGLEVLDSGIFKYKGKILSITTNSNPGKFLKQSIDDSNHFVPDTFCFEKFKTPSPNETRGIIRNIKNKLKKDNLTIKYKRVGEGYVLTEILNNQSQIDHK